MKRMLLLMGTMLSLFVFIIVTSSVPSFAGEKAALALEEVDLPITFSKDGNMKKMKPKKDSGWEPVDEKDIPGGAELIYDSTVNIKVYKINPCYVCMGGQCYVNPNC